MISNAARLLRLSALSVLYIGALGTSLWLSYQLRFDFSVPPDYAKNFAKILFGLLALKLFLLLVLGQFGSLLSYFGVHDVQKIFVATFTASLAALAVWSFDGVVWAPPRAVILTDFMISFLALCSIRMGLRLLREGYFNNAQEIGAPRRQVAIIGAGDVGASVAKDFLVRRGLGMKPVAFFDDDQRKWGTRIHGVTVVGAPESIPDFLRKTKLDEAVLAMPSATGKRVQEIVRMLTRVGLKFEIVPSVAQLVTGKVRVSQIRAVEIQDLLGRTPINLETDKIRRLVQGKVVMVTGAGGSIGSELCRQIASYAPQRLLLIERCEVQLFQIEQELVTLGHEAEVVPLVADILDGERMSSIMERFRPNLVFHAAAHKHVPLMEHQPAEAFRNNTLGTQKLADLCEKTAVERLVFISTDKAINPTNVMGATKRMAELYLQARQKESAQPTKYMAVRFGNVLGSSGSVIPTFKKQIAAGGPITVTHKDVTRYFMTVNEAVGLVLQSATLGNGGEIFVLDMGRPMKIVDLARQLIELSGLEPEIDIEIRYTGLRPGEKLFEELNHNSENMVPTDHPKIMQFVSEPQSLVRLRSDFDRLQADAPALSADEVKTAIKFLVPEYQPYVTL